MAREERQPGQSDFEELTNGSAEEKALWSQAYLEYLDSILRLNSREEAKKAADMPGKAEAES